MKRMIGQRQDRRLVYQNDFADPGAMEDLTVVYGEMEVRDGALRTVKEKGGHSSALLRSPNRSSFVIEADFISRQGGGGIFFAGSPGRAKASTGEDDFTNGYYAFVGQDGTVGALGCTSTAGRWNGNVTASYAGKLDPGADLRFAIRVTGDYIIYRLLDRASGEEVYRAEYKKGDSRYDPSPFESGMIAFRLNNDGGKGGFTGVRVYAPKTAEMSDVTLAPGEKLTAMLRAENAEELLVFADKGQGYAFSYDAETERLLAYRYLNGALYFIAQHAMKITAGREYPFSAVHRGDVLAFSFGDQTWPVLEVHLEKPKTFTVGSTAPVEVEVAPAELWQGPTYTNPVTYGADPEILYHDGTFYLYTLDQTGPYCRVRVRTSKDLCEWEEGGFCFGIDENSPIHYFMSPNVFHKDGWFYLLIASQFAGGFGPTEFRVFYARSRRPDGPFEMDPVKPYINTVPEIGGAPFVDDDGRVYITTVRFGGGNHVYIQELNAENGVLSTKREAVHCVSPSEHYEIDEYGHISEGGVIIKHNGWYYMMFASGHFRGHYGESYAVSRDVYGPYTKYRYNEVLSSNLYVDGVGDCMFVVCPELEETFVTYHCHASRGNKGFSRDICVDRVYFVPSEDGGPDVLRVYGPTTTPVPAPKFKK